jgi:hypothetical protein
VRLVAASTSVPCLSSRTDGRNVPGAGWAGKGSSHLCRVAASTHLAPGGPPTPLHFPWRTPWTGSLCLRSGKTPCHFPALRPPFCLSLRASPPRPSWPRPSPPPPWTTHHSWTGHLVTPRWMLVRCVLTRQCLVVQLLQLLPPPLPPSRQMPLPAPAFLVVCLGAVAPPAQPMPGLAARPSSASRQTPATAPPPGTNRRSTEQRREARDVHCPTFVRTGHCQLGGRCIFLHCRRTFAARRSALGRWGNPIRPEELTCPVQVRQSGSCTRGMLCHFHHPYPGPGTSTSAARPPARAATPTNARERDMVT